MANQIVIMAHGVDNDFVTAHLRCADHANQTHTAIGGVVTQLGSPVAYQAPDSQEWQVVMPILIDMRPIPNLPSTPT